MRARFLLIPLVAAAALLAGCKTNTPAAPAPTDNGVSALSAQEILAKATAALGEAKSFHVKGEVVEEGDKIAADMVIAKQDFKGTVTVQGSSIEIIKVGSDIYFKAPDDFWRSQIPAGQAEAILLLLKGKYVKMSGSAPSAAEFATLSDPAELLKLEGTLTKGDAKTINGQPAIGVKTTEGTLYVATTGKPLPLRLEAATGQGLDFTEYDANVEIKAPSASEVFDLSGFTGG